MFLNNLRYLLIIICTFTLHVHCLPAWRNFWSCNTLECLSWWTWCCSNLLRMFSTLAISNRWASSFIWSCSSTASRTSRHDVYCLCFYLLLCDFHLLIQVKINYTILDLSFGGGISLQGSIHNHFPCSIIFPKLIHEFLCLNDIEDGIGW